jgi:uncharacterized membrane protein
LMLRIVLLLSGGSILLALLVTLQVKFTGADWGSIAKYYLAVLPVLFTANIFIGLGLNKGHAIFHNLPLLIAVQTFVYYLMIALFSVYILGNKLSVPRTAIAFSLIIFAIYLLKS